MATSYKILIMGASYGSLLGAKMALAGHTVKLVCLPEEVELINSEGARVRMAARGVEGLVELDSQTMPGDLSAAGPGDVDPADYDLIALAMQEPQYGVPAVGELLGRVFGTLLGVTLLEFGLVFGQLPFLRCPGGVWIVIAL